MPGHHLGMHTGQRPSPVAIRLQAPCSGDVKGLGCLDTSCWAGGSSAKGWNQRVLFTCMDKMKVLEYGSLSGEVQQM